MPAISQHQPNARQPDMQQTTAPPAKHKRFASLLRLPSSSPRKDKDKESPSASSSRAPRATTNPTTPTAPAQSAPSASASYFSPQPGSSGSSGSGTDLRSPGSKRPPASFSGHGINNSRGPPVSLITRGNSDYVRKKAPATTPTQPQRQHSGLPTPIAGLQRMGPQADDDDSDTSSASEATASIPAASKPTLSRQSTVTSVRSSRHMASMRDESSGLDDTRSAHIGRAKRNVSGTESEDLFLNIAEDNAPKRRAIDAAARQDRLRSRIARVNNRHSTPSGAQTSSPAHVMSAYTTPTTSRIPFTSSTDPKASALPRRTTTFPAPARTTYQSPLSPTNPTDTQRTRLPELNAKTSFSSSRRDAELSPSEFLASMRRPSVPDTLQTPPKRAATYAYRPSNLSYTPARLEPKTPQSESRHEASSHHDTESHGSTGPAASVWDELDELKTRIKKIEIGGGKTPATSNAAVAQASAERPRTANTTATTVSSSPHQQRKPSGSPSESTVEAPANKVHPLLRDALAKAKQHTTISVYRALETTAAEAIALAEMAGSTGMLSSAASVYSGAGAADRQVRRKADNLCRSLTELCIALCDTKPSLVSPAMRSSAAVAASAAARRPSVQVNGESPKATRDGEDTDSVISFSGVSPSRALERIEARRTSMLAASTSKRPTSRDTNGSTDPLTASRVQRASTSMNRTRRQSDADVDGDEDEDDTLRAPSRAMTDFRQLRSINTNTSTPTNVNNSSFEKNRHSRTYTSQEPMPELQPSPKFQPTPSQRRPTVTGVPNENGLLFRDSTRRFNFDRQSSPAVEKQTVNGLRERLQLGANRINPNRNSIGTTADLSRSMSLGRTRMRGASTGQ
ncbi:uncharacterized protein M421DRAFT_424716 [Didymella exigua CBS 183.55]|uniref:Uncharacterized protein n=1 Tax=Didymella exigua CBS 183.55 TaxID=1150837 RepID=A0A6A5RBC2_9PLEO|nr:uncharacterized protein M421DRAFT_424716 [Didymella exigua CBS 183.55]KAF1924580.1 hypothetical protein M421DRAFT_424716 [Didymella exigua CBS 183.55]